MGFVSVHFILFVSLGIFFEKEKSHLLNHQNSIL